MTLPVSSYEALLVQVRELTNETILLQKQLSSDLFDSVDPTDLNHNLTRLQNNFESDKLLADNVIRQCDRSRFFETEQRLLSDKNSFKLHHLPGFLETVPESLDPGELTAKLITWRDHAQQNLSNSQEEPQLRRGKQQQLGTFRLDKPIFPVCCSNVDNPEVAKISTNYETKEHTPADLLLERDHKSTVTSCQFASLPPSLTRERCKDKGNNQHVMEGKTKEAKPEIYSRGSNRYQEEECSSEKEIKPEDSDASRLLSHHETWPVKRDTWTGSPSFPGQTSSAPSHDMASVMSFSSGSGCSGSLQGHRRLGAKVDVVYSLLGMLGSNEGREDMSGTLLAMSNSMDSCLVMRQSGCLPLLIQLIHAPGQGPETRERASQALHNVIHARSDEKVGRREARVLRLLEQIRDYCQVLRISLETDRPLDDLERHPGPTIAALMKLSFDEAHRHAMCQLGGLHAVAELIEMDHAAHGSDSNDQTCVTLRRYAGMALTNLTFGDGNNKALLCSFKEFMRALVSQLQSLSDDLRQVTASVLRNLSWRADSSSKQTLREVGAVTGLMKASMEGSKESTLKSILSALWNLSAHCSTNKVDICAVEGALAFLVDMLSYNAPSKTLAIVENAGGILRNVSSHIAVRDDYRTIVRDRGCLQVLLGQLRSPSLTVVSNACGALWNLSARCPHDQRLLWDLGAVPMLRSLVHSKHKMISMGSSAALKNLLSARPGGSNLVHLDSTARGLGLSALPTLGARRQRALEQEIDQNLSETCENIEPSTSPTNKEDKFTFKESSFVDIASANSRVRSYQHGKCHGVSRSESRESMRSITSTHSDTIFERVHRHVTTASLNPTDLQIKQQSSSLHSAVDFNQSSSDFHNKTSQLEKNYALKYKKSITDRTRPVELGINMLDIRDLRCTTSTMSWATGPDQESACSLTRSLNEEKLLSPSNVLQLDEEPLIETNFSRIISPTLSVTKIPTVASAVILSPTTSHSSEGDIFGVYAETDLDQPTNYSLRYAEQNSDEDEKQSSRYFAGSEQDIEDTIKTYYTEGTPYENSLNSSRATSHSDLQDDSKVKNFSADKIQPSEKLNVEENLIVSKIRDFNLSGRKSSSKRNSYIDRTENQGLSLSLSSKRLSLPPNAIDINSDIDSGIASNLSQTTFDAKESDIVMESTVRLKSFVTEDEPKILNDGKPKELKIFRRQNGNFEPESLTESMASDGDDDDEDLLAACIHIGMQNNRHRQLFRRNSLEKTTRGEGSLTRYQTSSELDQVEGNDDSKSLNIINPDIADNDQSDTIEFVSLEDNLNINDDNDKITAEYQKFETESFSKKYINKEKCEKEDDSLINSIEENEMHPMTECTESIESYDSVERSEQVLLQHCIKSAIDNKSSDSISLKSEDSTDAKMSSSDHQAIEKEEINNGDEYRRQRDPDAMIACLDRLTATLVKQSEAMRERDSSTAMKQSTHSDKVDTWNEDSPNDVSFPTITTSVPLVASFKSDNQDDNPGTLQSLSEDSPVLAKEELNDDIMTTSTIIEQEAFKLAEAVNAEFRAMNLPFHDLESIKPPSTMNSLVSLSTSCGGPESFENSFSRDRCYSTSLPSPFFKGRGSRKKSLPIGMVAKRALGHTGNRSQSGSLESVFCDSNISQLDNMKPPSMMEEILGLESVDMENSMLSVASITSEIADSKDEDSLNSLTSSDPIYDLVKPVANILSITCMKYAEENANNSLSEYLENINPPSLLNEVSEMDDTTIDANTDTMCSDTLCMDVELFTEEIIMTNPIFPDRIEEVDNDTDDAATPLSTEYSLSSSAESTPKKRLNKNHLTPKQKRQLAKERYKTYTIAAELVKKEEEERRKTNAEAESSLHKKSPFSKLTPKQKRQEDRARFQTQVLENPFATIPIHNETQVTDKKLGDTIQTLGKSGIPSFKGFSGSGTFRRKQSSENNERYRTQTLKESDTETGDTSEDMQTMLEKNANIVLNHLNENTKAKESLLICEAIVSNDVESNQTYPGRFSTYVRKSRQENEFCGIVDVCPNVGPAPESYAKKEEEDHAVVSDEESQSSGSEEIQIEISKEQPKRPRITKPGFISRDNSGDSSNAEKSEPVSPKGIRGRRKALYSNPNTRRTTPQSSPVKTSNSSIPIGRSNTSPMVRATRATTLRQNNNSNATKDVNFPQKTNFLAKNIGLSKRSSIPQRGQSSAVYAKSVKRHSTPPSCSTSSEKKKVDVPKPLERQGTFTKDEPEMENVPTVSANSSPKKESKIVKPIWGSPSKIKPKIPVKNFQSKLTKCASAEGIPGKRLSIGDITKTPENGNSKKTITLGIRSASNLSIGLQTSPGGSKKVTKDATSKIASLWKKVEESKNKQRYEKPDTRQWITGSSDKTDGESLTPKSPSTFRLFRSSTFEGVPKESNHQVKNKSKMPMRSSKVSINEPTNRSSCDFSSASGSESKIPKFGDSKTKNSQQGYESPIVFRKQKSVDSTETDLTKRISRLGSFIRVDAENPDGIRVVNIPGCEIDFAARTSVVTASSKVTIV